MWGSSQHFRVRSQNRGPEEKEICLAGAHSFPLWSLGWYILVQVMNCSMKELQEEVSRLFCFWNAKQESDRSLERPWRSESSNPTLHEITLSEATLDGDFQETWSFWHLSSGEGTFHLQMYTYRLDTGSGDKWDMLLQRKHLGQVNLPHASMKWWWKWLDTLL